MATLAFNELMLIYKDLLTLPVQRESFFLKKSEIIKKQTFLWGFCEKPPWLHGIILKALNERDSDNFHECFR